MLTFPTHILTITKTPLKFELTINTYKYNNLIGNSYNKELQEQNNYNKEEQMYHINLLKETWYHRQAMEQSGEGLNDTFILPTLFRE